MKSLFVLLLVLFSASVFASVGLDRALVRGSLGSLWPWFQPTEPAANAPVLPNLAKAADSPDAVWRICCSGRPKNCVGTHLRPIRFGACLSVALVNLRPPALGQETASPYFLRNRSPA